MTGFPLTSLDASLVVPASPFHDRAAELCRTNAWVRRGGLTLVDVYSEVSEEYWAARADAGLADLSFLSSYRIKGPGARDALAHLLASPLSPLEPSTLTEALWCNDGGFIIGAGELYREAEESFILVTAERCLSWLSDSLAGYGCVLSDLTPATARLGLAGPAATAIFEALGLNAALRLAPRGFVVGTLRGLSIGVGRLGEARYELWCAAPEARVLWDRLMRAGKPLGLKPLGVAAQRILRLEDGVPEPGTDYKSALTAPSWQEIATPVALGAHRLLDLARPGFVGREALTGLVQPPRRLVRLLAATTGPIGGATITRADQSPAGYLTSSAYSPGFGGSLALGWVEGPGEGEGPFGLVLAPDAQSRGQLRRIACRPLPCRPLPRT